MKFTWITEKGPSMETISGGLRQSEDPPEF